jgi:hypothetical protein
VEWQRLVPSVLRHDSTALGSVGKRCQQRLGRGRRWNDPEVERQGLVPSVLRHDSSLSMGKRSVGKLMQATSGPWDGNGTILKWNGSAWSPQSSGTTQNLWECGEAMPSNVWAVGEGGTILKWNGGAWSPQSSGTTGTPVGSVGKRCQQRLGRGIWRNDPEMERTALGSLSPPARHKSLTSVWGTDASNVWAVGLNGTILKWNGSAWSLRPPRLDML